MVEDEKVGPYFLWTAYDPCVQDAVFEYVKAEAGPNSQVHILRTESLSDELSTCTLFGFLVSALRKRKAFPNWRTTVLTIPEHYQALHLCTARAKQRSGKFDALASEVMYADILYKKHLSNQHIPVESEYVQEYLDFLAHSNTLNNWQVLKAFRDALEKDSTLAVQAAKSVYLVHGPITTAFTKECIEVLFQGRKVRRIVTEAPLDISVNEDYDVKDVSVKAEVSDVPEPDASTVEKLDSNTAEYTVRIVNAFLRILVNSRDELALATAMASPVIQLPHDAFTELKRLSLEKKSPMCQTAVSYVVRARLGGDSYAAPEDCPLKPYICKLAAFVDVLHKLQTAVEEDPTDVAIANILSTLARRIRTASGHGLVWETVVRCKAELVQLAQMFQKQGTENMDGANDGTLGIDTLCVLRRLSDFLSTRRVTCSPVSVIYNLNTNSTPLNIPHLLEYFKTPEPESEDDEYDVPLTKRLSEKFEREGAPQLTAVLRAVSDNKKESSIHKLPDEASSSLLAHKEEPNMSQMKARKKDLASQAKPSAPRKAAKRNILSDINSVSKKQRASSKFVCKDQARITSFFCKA
ncbi:PCNA-interacting partner-like [Dermacentor variabilis]|uniref:PCNA-interacting partner-like n=1 Tax=Dermacentor variabilis TaxID=34621 RepID=UPI003F5C12D3